MADILFAVPQPRKRKRVTKPHGTRRDDLLTAAEQVFGEKGVAATRIGDITDAANVAKGTFYLYFKSKDELLGALWEERYVVGFVRQTATVLERAAAEGWWSVADRIVETLVDYDLAHRRLHKLLYEAATGEALRLFREANEQVVALLIAGIDAGVAAGDFHSRDPALGGRLIFYAADAALHDVILHDAKISRDDLVGGLKELIHKSLGPAPAARGSRPRRRTAKAAAVA